MKCFAAPFELKKLPELFWKQFVGADGGVTRPYKSISRGGPAPRNWFVGAVALRSAPTNCFQNNSGNSFNSKGAAKHFKKNWNFYHCQLVSCRTLEKYNQYNSTCLVFKSVHNTKFALSYMRCKYDIAILCCFNTSIQYIHWNVF